jgi:hypothetical protein
MAVAITDSTTEFVSVSALKQHLNITASTWDAELALICDAAQEHVESLIGPVLHRTVVQTASASAGRELVLNTTPAMTVTSITGAGSPLSGYTLNAATGIVGDVSYTGSATVTYTVGRTSCPAAVVMATLIIAKHLWETQTGNTPSAMPDAEEFDTATDLGFGFAVPRRAAELLTPYLLLPGVA